MEITFLGKRLGIIDEGKKEKYPYNTYKATSCQDINFPLEKYEM